MSKRSKKRDKGRKETPEKADAQVPQAEAAATGPEQELDEIKQRLQRLGADYQNYQKRSLRQLEQAAQFSKENMVKALLPVLDNFEHALAKGGEAQDVAALLEGVRIVYDHLMNVLQGAGMERIEVRPASAFDPNLHEAMMHQESKDQPEHTVLMELAPGYVMNGRTLRPAKVSVAKASIQEQVQETAEESVENTAEPTDEDSQEEAQGQEV